MVVQPWISSLVLTIFILDELNKHTDFAIKHRLQH